MLLTICIYFIIVSLILFVCYSGVALMFNHSVVSNSATPWTVAHQAPPSMGFSRQEHWSGEPFPSPGDLPDPEIKPWSPALQVDSLHLSCQGSP